jgi:hypothetical protein
VGLEDQMSLQHHSRHAPAYSALSKAPEAPSRLSSRSWQCPADLPWILRDSGFSRGGHLWGTADVWLSVPATDLRTASATTAPGIRIVIVIEIDYVLADYPNELSRQRQRAVMHCPSPFF